MALESKAAAVVTPPHTSQVGRRRRRRLGTPTNHAPTGRTLSEQGKRERRENHQCEIAKIIRKKLLPSFKRAFDFFLRPR